MELLSYFPRCQFSRDVNETQNISIDILIGQDHCWNLIKATELVQSPSGLVAQKTRFGLWLLSGAYHHAKEVKTVNCRQFICLNDISETHSRNIWDLNYLECEHKNNKTPINKTLEHFETTISKIEGRYEVALPWVEKKKPLLLSNITEALRRLEGLEKKIVKDENLREGYNKVLENMEVEGIIEEVTVEQGCGPSVFYLPHRPVVKNSTLATKIRPVFDASATGQNGISLNLNECMETGPNLLPLLSDILIRFRRHKLAICGDIEKAFLQISVRLEERDVHRFFWKVDDAIRTMRITRVPFGNRARPFLLNVTVRHHLSQYDSERRVVQDLSQNMYVDDWLSGSDSVEEVLDMVSEASSIMSEAGMKLTKWSSNSSDVAEKTQQHFQNKTSGLESTEVLGVCWNPEADAFKFDCMAVSPGVVVTKRLILSCIARIFDPLGLITPFVISIKILFQEVWEMGLTWDEPVPGSIERRFSAWMNHMFVLPELSFSRCFVSVSWEKKRSVELHCFCDASLKAYGAVVYLKVLESDGSVSSVVKG